jgi:uncharacterized protein (TIGR00251 family)
LRRPRASIRLPLESAFVTAVFTDGRGGAVATVRVTPRASRTRIDGVRDGVLLVKVGAPPVDAAANDALIDLLAGTFRVPRRDVRITAGARSRTKQVAIVGRAADLNAALAALG